MIPSDPVPHARGAPASPRPDPAVDSAPIGAVPGLTCVGKWGLLGHALRSVGPGALFDLILGVPAGLLAGWVGSIHAEARQRELERVLYGPNRGSRP